MKMSVKQNQKANFEAKPLKTVPFGLCTFQAAMASLTYELGLRKDIFANQGKDEDGDGRADVVDLDGDGDIDEEDRAKFDTYVPAAPGIDPYVAHSCKTPKPTSLDCYRATDMDVPTAKDVRLHSKFMPGYSGYIPNELRVKTEGGQWSPPKWLNVANKEGPKPYANLGANAPPSIFGPPRSVVFSRDGVFVEGGPAMRKAGMNLI